MLDSPGNQKRAINRFVHEGGCHCGDLRFRLETTKALTDFSPRACDCDFCTRHRAAWVSDRLGSLRIRARGAEGLRRYRQGFGAGGIPGLRGMRDAGSGGRA
ncbi:MAG TPA: hypothetical protein VIT22_14195 [Pseudoxanthomonas sp.]